MIHVTPPSQPCQTCSYLGVGHGLKRQSGLLFIDALRVLAVQIIVGLVFVLWAQICKKQEQKLRFLLSQELLLQFSVHSVQFINRSERRTEAAARPVQPTGSHSSLWSFVTQHPLLNFTARRFNCVFTWTACSSDVMMTYCGETTTTSEPRVESEQSELETDGFKTSKIFKQSGIMEQCTYICSEVKGLHRWWNEFKG